MATIIPAHWQTLAGSGAHGREIETLHCLAAHLADEYLVFHGVHWSRVERGTALFGEIDFVIMTPGGRLLLIEQKSGFLEEHPDGLMKRYAGTEKRVASQLNRNLQALQNRYGRAFAGKLELDYLFYCPDYRVRQPAVAGIDPERIVDASRRQQLAEIIRRLLPLDEPQALASQVRQFLSQELSLAPEIGSIATAVTALEQRLSEGLATWGRRIHAEPFRLRIIGSAGSGKTQLALAAMQDAQAAGRRLLYVCYNRPLADHMAQLAPPKAQVATYHQLCDRVLRSRGKTPDFSAAQAFRHLEQAFAQMLSEAPVAPDWQFDELIIDEGQDFSATWLEQLLRLVIPPGRVWWLEDPLQNLYEQPRLDLPGWVELHAHTNYRSPQEIVTSLRRLGVVPQTMTAASPLSGSEVDILTYEDARGLVEQTRKALTQGLSQGFKRPQLALLTWRGREHSQLLGYDRLGSHSLRRFNGQYDLLGNPLYDDGEVLAETLYRFKGQAAPWVVLTEIDFADYDERARRKLYVGATRASMRLTLVMSQRAAEKLMHYLPD